jgi:hypothetical protein
MIGRNPLHLMGYVGESSGDEEGKGYVEKVVMNKYDKYIKLIEENSKVAEVLKTLKGKKMREPDLMEGKPVLTLTIWSVCFLDVGYSNWCLMQHVKFVAQMMAWCFEKKHSPNAIALQIDELTSVVLLIVVSTWIGWRGGPENA